VASLCHGDLACLIQNKNTTHRNLSSAYQGKQLFHDSHNTSQCTSLQMIPAPPHFFFFFFGGKWQFQPTENSLCVNWRFILCLTELKLRRLCLISETKGNYTPVQKLVNPLQTTGRFSLLSFLNKELCGMS
jgi:hypothetical protein